MIAGSNWMSKQRILIVISTCLSIPVIMIIVMTSWMTEGSMPTDDKIISLSTILIDDSMTLLRKYPEGALLIYEEEWPESIKALSPLSVSADREGLYIKTKERFVDVWGVFIPREDSEKYLEETNMPSYNRIVKGIYKFYAG